MQSKLLSVLDITFLSIFSILHREGLLLKINQKNPAVFNMRVRRKKNPPVLLVNINHSAHSSITQFVSAQQAKKKYAWSTFVDTRPRPPPPPPHSAVCVCVFVFARESVCICFHVA